MSRRSTLGDLALGALTLPVVVEVGPPGIEIGDVDPVGAVIGTLSLIVALCTLHLTMRQERAGSPSWWRRKAVRNTIIAIATASAVFGAIKVALALSPEVGGNTGKTSTVPTVPTTPLPSPGAPHCRQSILVGEERYYAKINPCISIDSDNTISIWSDYTAEVTGTFTVFLWLVDAANADPVTSIYVSCPVTFTYVGQQQTEPCKKSGISPPRAGDWAASMIVEPGTPETPSIWNTNYKGTQSGRVTWAPIR